MKTLALLTLFLTPLAAFAAPRNLAELLDIFTKPILVVTPIVISGSLLVFFWGMAKFIYSTGNKVDLELGKKLMIWGVVALFVMTSVWGIVRIFNETIGEDGPPVIPFLPTSANPAGGDGFYQGRYGR